MQITPNLNNYSNKQNFKANVVVSKDLLHSVLAPVGMYHEIKAIDTAIERGHIAHDNKIDWTDIPVFGVKGGLLVADIRTSVGKALIDARKKLFNMTAGESFVKQRDFIEAEAERIANLPETVKVEN